MQWSAQKRGRLIMQKLLKKSRVFKIAIAWTNEQVLNNHLNDAFKLCGGYVGAKYRNVKVTVSVEEMPKLSKKNKKKLS